MNQDNRAILQAIQTLAGRDLDETTDDQLRAEILEAGGDPEAIAQRVSEALDGVIAEFMRGRAAASKALMKTATRSAPRNRPTLDRIRELVQGAFNSNPQLAAAFRDGNKQSENDLLSLYDDLVSMGKIDPADGC